MGLPVGKGEMQRSYHISLEEIKINETEAGEKKAARNREDAGGTLIG